MGSFLRVFVACGYLATQPLPGLRAGQDLTSTGKVCIKNSGVSPKVFEKVRVELRNWARFDLTDDERATDFLLVLSAKTKPVETIQIQSLEEGASENPPETAEFLVLSIVKKTRLRESVVAEFTTRSSWRAGRDARDLVKQLKKFIDQEHPAKQQGQ